MSETAVNGVEPIIFLDDVHVTFRTRTGSILHPTLVHAVQGVTIKLMPGQTIGIVGESGCGKSTTANVMCGLQAPTSGKVYFKGKDVTKRTAEDRRHMGRVISVVFQNPATALNPRMVVREQLLDPMRGHNLGTEAEQEKRVKELLELTGLPSSAAEVLPGQLSGGQRQRVAIARALSLNPDAIIADEPTSALDVSVRAQILNLLTDLKKELGLAMVLISHDIQTVRYISDDIIVMNGGKIVEQGEAVLFIDKHAAHERIRLEARIKVDHPFMAQLLLAPVSAELSREEAAAVLENRALLERCGFEAEDFGGGDVLIRQIPSDVDVEDAKALLQELAGKLLAGKTLDPNGLRDELLHSIACKSAIKAGWQTSDEELRRLVQEVLTRDDIKYCPHGRPVCVPLTKRQLEKPFRRV